MGYESKLLLTLPSILAHNGERFCQLVAMVDLSKVGYDGPVYNEMKAARTREKARLADDPLAARYGVYDLNGDDMVTKDPYDDPLAPVDLDRLIDAMAEAYEQEPYRRYALALPLLRAWRDAPFGDDALVLHYGH